MKMGLKGGYRAYLLNAPASAIEAMDMPELEVIEQLRGFFDYIHLFVRTQTELDNEFPKLRDHLRPSGKIWVSWPKAKQLGTDLTLPTVIRIGYDHGMVESTTLSIDSVWSAIKFTHPKQGKTYSNSYGTLPEGDDLPAGSYQPPSDRE